MDPLYIVPEEDDELDEDDTISTGFSKGILVFDRAPSPDETDSTSNGDSYFPSSNLRRNSSSSSTNLRRTSSSSSGWSTPGWSSEPDLRETDNSSILSIPVEELKARFDIVTTKEVQDRKRKYVVYLVMVTEVPQIDTDKAIVERRYSDFYTLHRGLRRDCPAAIKGVSFPQKEWFGRGLDESVIESRKRQFEKYLTYVYHQPRVRNSQPFQEFFHLPHLRQATMSLRCENYGDSYRNYKLVMFLLKKLGVCKHELIHAMCCLIEVCSSIREFEEADALATTALDKLQYDPNQMCLLPLIRATLEIRKRLFLNSTWLKEKLIECENLNTGDPDLTLREMAVKWSR